jgi:hypothetical protein
VSLDYADRAPFEFKGEIEKVVVQYIGAPSTSSESADISID